MAIDKIRHFSVTIEGAALLMHNPQLADPLNEWAKRLKEQTGKRKKSDGDHEEIARVEFQGGLYFDEKMGPFLPGHMVDACVKAGAKKKRLGSIFASCVRTTKDAYRLVYTGPRTREELWKDPKFRDRRGAGVQKARVIRTRPKFTDWSLTFDLDLFPSEINPGDVEQAITDAGIYCGLGDFRPTFGLFTVKAFKEI